MMKKVIQPFQGKIPVPQSPAEDDEESSLGSAPDPDNEETALEEAKEMGLYTEAKEDEPAELDLAGEVRKQQNE